MADSHSEQDASLGWRALALVFVVAFGARAVYLVEMRESPLFAVLLGDGAIYDAWARRIAHGSGWGSGAYYQTPLYPWFLSAVYLVAPFVEVARWVQALVGAASCVLIASASARLLERRAGIVAGCLLALYAPAIAYDGAIEKTVLDVFGVSLLLALLAPQAARSLARCFAVGFVLAAASINRESLLCSYAVIVPWTLLRTEGSRARSFGMLAAGSAIVFALAALQNWKLHGEFTPLRGQFGANLYMGNNARADGLYVPLVASHGNAVDEERDARHAAEAELGRSLTRGQVSDYWRDRALAWMRANPGDAAALFARKLRYTLHDNEWADSHGYAAYRKESLVLLGLGWVLRFGSLGALAAFGFAAAWPARRHWWPLAALIAMLTLATAAFFVFGRYRLVLVPLLVPFAAAALVDIARLPRFDAKRWIGAAAAVVLAASAFAPTAARDESVLDTWLNASGALCAQDRAADAELLARRALALDAQRPDVHARLAHVLACNGRWDEAEGEAARAAELDPTWRAQAAFELGLAAGRGGDLERAARWLRASVDADPELARAWERLGVALRGLGRAAEAEAALRRAHQCDPNDPDALNDLGYLLERSGRIDEARQAYADALALDPDHPQARANLAHLGAN